MTSETKPKAKKKARWRRRILWVAVPLLVVLTVVAIWVNDIDRRAALLAATGKSVITMFGELGKALVTAEPAAIEDLFDDAFVSNNTGGWSEREHERHDGIRRWSWTPTTGSCDRATAIAQLVRVRAAMGKVDQLKFKLRSIEHLPEDERTSVLGTMVARGEGASGGTYQAEARLRFALRRVNGSWRISGQELLSGWATAGSGEGFSEIAKQAGIDFEARSNPAWETPEWKPHTFEIIKYALAGATALDYDGDGLEDILLGDGQSPRLYRNLGGARFEDATAAAGLPLDLTGTSLFLAADFDNDGDQDLLCGRITEPNRLYRNDGDGTFTDVTEGAGIGGYLVSTGALADYDNDGLVDIYLGRYLDPRDDLPTTLFYTRNSPNNSLLKNRGGLVFEDVTDAAHAHDNGLTLGTAFGDYDRDGWIDLYVVNDFGRNTLFHNEGDGTFRDVSIETGTVDIGYGMSSAFADLNNDGLLDIYVANVHSGQRWFGQAATLHRYMLTSIMQGTFFQDLPLYRELHSLIGSDWDGLGDKVIRGNSLFLNRGDGTFQDVSEAAGSNPPGWYWSCGIFDYDNDGLQDVYAVNGWITGATKDDL